MSLTPAAGVGGPDRPIAFATFRSACPNILISSSHRLCRWQAIMCAWNVKQLS